MSGPPRLDRVRVKCPHCPKFVDVYASADGRIRTQQHDRTERRGRGAVKLYCSADQVVGEWRAQ